jgi:hypothetical protein
MFKTLRPWQLLVVAAAGWINRDQQAIISYLQEENRGYCQLEAVAGKLGE